MTALVISCICIFIFVLIFFAITYFVFTFTFVNPKSNRNLSRNFPDNIIYKTRKEKFLEVVEKLENTDSESVSITADDGILLHGSYFENNPKAPLIIFFHGYHGTFKWDGYGTFKTATENGWNILMTDLRAHGKSTGNVITFGIKESLDVKTWTNYAASRFGKSTPVFISGMSLGAASVLMAGNLSLPQNVKGIISDSAFSNAEEQIKTAIHFMHLPVIPVYFFVVLGAKIFGHFDFRKSSPLEAVKKINLPILFIHAKKDTIVPVKMCDDLYNACTSKKFLLQINNGDHTATATDDYSSYKKAVESFVKSLS
ncbi:MAG: alpha/beta hydrolase [Treponema sp.]|nr:alpha/beta hydrolase [Treponema sp.]